MLESRDAQALAPEIQRRRLTTSDLGRRIWRRDPRAARVLLLPPATDLKTAVAEWRCGARGTSAVAVHRPKVRRGAAAKLGGVFQGRKNCSQAVVRGRMLFFVSIAGEVDDLVVCSVSSSSYCSSFVLCTVYVFM